MKKNLTIVGIFAVLLSTATFGAANAGELPTLPAVKGDRLVRVAGLAELSPARFMRELAVDSLMTGALTAPSQFVREPRGTAGFLGGLPLMKVMLAPPQYFVLPPVQAACFGFGDPDGMKCVGRAVITVLHAPSPIGCAGFGDPEGFVCDSRIIY